MFLFQYGNVAIEKTIKDLPDAVNISALFRAANGGLGLALGMVAIYSIQNYQAVLTTVLLSLGTGFILVNAALLSGKLRGFSDELPLPPMVIFLILTLIAYYSALS